MSYVDGCTMEVCTASGEKRYYRYAQSIGQELSWQLVKQIKTNGHRVHFDYTIQNKESRLTSIRTTNAAEDLTFNSIEVKPGPNAMSYTLSASNGESAHYQLQAISGYVEQRLEPESRLAKRKTVIPMIPWDA